MKEKITRKEAIKKAGVAALATTSLLLLDTKAKACTSGGGYDVHDKSGGGDRSGYEGPGGHGGPSGPGGHSGPGGSGGH